MVGGVQSRAGSWIPATEKIGGGPSVLYDAVAILPGKDAEESLAKSPAARDFANDAFAHLKFIAYTSPALTLFEKCGLAANLDGGCVSLSKELDVSKFVKLCTALRFWDRAESLGAQA